MSTSSTAPSRPVAGRARLSTHLCFGNYKGRAVAPRQYAPLFPAFLGVAVDEIHLEMASRELAEAELVGTIAETKDVAVGVIDVKSYYVETPEDVAARVRRFAELAPPERLAFSTDCGPQPDRALGREAEAREPRRRRPARPRRAVIEPPPDDAGRRPTSGGSGRAASSSVTRASTCSSTPISPTR